MNVGGIKLSPEIQNALVSAGDKSGVDFSYLLDTAVRESSLNPSARAKTSTAVGLFQFLEGTWLEVMKEQGPSLGYERYARQISKDESGYHIADKGARQFILGLRNDPEISSDLAAAFTRQNGEYLSEKFGRHPSPGELYIAHFLGARGAEKLFDLGLRAPDEIAAKHFVRQAEANPAIFYDGQRALSIKEVYQKLVAKHQGNAVAPAPVASPQFTAQQSVPLPEAPSAPFAVPNVQSFHDLYRAQLPQSQGASGPSDGNSNSSQTGGLFGSLFTR